jgi:hypothetical protein
LHTDVPPVLYSPALHCDPPPDVEPATLHAEPGGAVQSVHVVAPAVLNLPAGHIAAVGLDTTDPAPHA